MSAILGTCARARLQVKESTEPHQVPVRVGSLALGSQVVATVMALLFVPGARA